MTLFSFNMLAVDMVVGTPTDQHICGRIQQVLYGTHSTFQTMIVICTCVIYKKNIHGRCPPFATVESEGYFQNFLQQCDTSGRHALEFGFAYLNTSLHICPPHIFGNKAAYGTYGSKSWFPGFQGQIYNPAYA